MAMFILARPERKSLTAKGILKNRGCYRESFLTIMIYAEETALSEKEGAFGNEGNAFHLGSLVFVFIIFVQSHAQDLYAFASGTAS